MRAMSEVLPARARAPPRGPTARSPRGSARPLALPNFISEYRIETTANAHVDRVVKRGARDLTSQARALLGPWVARYTNPTLISTQTSSFAFFVFWTSSWRVFHVSSTFTETIFVSFGTCSSKYPLKPSSSKPINTSMSMLSSLVGL